MSVAPLYIRTPPTRSPPCLRRALRADRHARAALLRRLHRGGRRRMEIRPTRLWRTWRAWPDAVEHDPSRDVALRDDRDDRLAPRVDRRRDSVARAHPAPGGRVHRAPSRDFRDLDELTTGPQPATPRSRRPAQDREVVLGDQHRPQRRGAGDHVVFSLEMPRHEVGMRMLCSAARAPWDRIRQAGRLRRSGPAWSGWPSGSTTHRCRSWTPATSTSSTSAPRPGG